MDVDEDAAQKTRVLAERLLDETKSGRAEWSLLGDNHFSLEAKSGTILLRQVREGYVLTVVNSDGTEVAALYAAEPIQLEHEVVLEGLFDTVRRQVLGVDKTLDALLSEFPG